jgi:hypothetical protein
VKTFFIACIVLWCSCESSSNASGDSSFENDKAEILKVMDQQVNAWNAFDLEGFMQGYWKSDALKFYGSNGVTQGWEQTLKNYKNRYPSRDYTGELNFTIDAISNIEKGSYYVMGQYHLKRSVGDANGIFMVIFKKIDGMWKIIADSSC